MGLVGFVLSHTCISFLTIIAHRLQMSHPSDGLNLLVTWRPRDRGDKNSLCVVILLLVTIKSKAVSVGIRRFPSNSGFPQLPVSLNFRTRIPRMARYVSSKHCFNSGISPDLHVTKMSVMLLQLSNRSNSCKTNLCPIYVIQFTIHYLGLLFRAILCQFL